MTASGDVQTLVVDRLGHLGDGIAGDVFVARALPGEQVEGVVTGKRMAAPRILSPSPERVVPPCPHYADCGGCALQHLGDDAMAAWKTGVVTVALAGQGIAAPVRPIQTSPPRSRRRAVLTGKVVGRSAVVGFHAPASHRLVAIPECQLLHPEIMATLPGLERLTLAGAGGKAREVVFTVTRSPEGADVAARGGRAPDLSLREEIGSVAAEFGFARLVWDAEPMVQRAPPAQRFGSARVVPPPGAFLQATEAGERALQAAVAMALRDAPRPLRRVADLFAGCGTFALPIARAVAVHAVEGEAEMIAALRAAARSTPGLKPVTAEARDLFRRPLRAAELAGFDAVVIDPPRAGAEAQVAEIAAARVPLVAMVSCNPVSFARDARGLVDAGYRIDWVQPVDQFRWSPHVELAARLVFDHIAA